NARKPVSRETDFPNLDLAPDLFHVKQRCHPRAPGRLYSGTNLTNTRFCARRAKHHADPV
ncbi:MAG: hypothetical protein ACKV2U_10990, partial [Bryobacteraceae bacterium]